MSGISQQQKYEMIIKEEEGKSNNLQDTGFLDYCRSCRESCENVGITFGGVKNDTLVNGDK